MERPDPEVLANSEAPSIRYRHLAELVRDSASRFADGVAFTTCLANGMHGSLKFGEVDRFSDAFAGYLRDVLKLEPGARVALLTPNSLAFPVVAFGVFKAGCVLVTINPLYSSTEIEERLVDAGAEVLVIVDMFTGKLEPMIDRIPVRKIVTVEVTQFFSAVPRAVIRGVMKVWERVLPRVKVPHEPLTTALELGAKKLAPDANKAERYTDDQGPETLAVLQYTGGTTGASKGAMLSHGNLLANFEQSFSMGKPLIEEGRDCVLTALPLYHSFAFQINLLCFFGAGARNVLIPNPRPVRNLQRAFDNYPVTWVSGINTLFAALLNEEWFTAFPPKRLKASVAGGAALHPLVAERWEKTTGSVIAEGYGLTEASPVVSFNPLSGIRKPGSIGLPLPGTEMRLVDEEGNVAPDGEPGELLVRGPQVMQGYWNSPEDTSNTLRDGWLHTGDIATVDGDGYYRIVDRKTDMIIVSGFNVYPNEVEDVIDRLDQVEEVAVIGVPDSKTGEAVRAYIVSHGHLTAEDVVRHCELHLARYKLPKSVEFRRELPKTPVGKIYRKVLRTEAADAN